MKNPYPDPPNYSAPPPQVAQPRTNKSLPSTIPPPQRPGEGTSYTTTPVSPQSLGATMCVAVLALPTQHPNSIWQAVVSNGWKSAQCNCFCPVSTKRPRVLWFLELERSPGKRWAFTLSILRYPSQELSMRGMQLFRKNARNATKKARASSILTLWCSNVSYTVLAACETQDKPGMALLV